MEVESEYRGTAERIGVVGDRLLVFGLPRGFGGVACPPVAPSTMRVIEARPDSFGARRALGGGGGHFGAPFTMRVIEARPGSFGAPRALGGAGARRGPLDNTPDVRDQLVILVSPCAVRLGQDVR